MNLPPDEAKTLRARMLDPLGPPVRNLLLPGAFVASLWPGVLAVMGHLPPAFGWSFCASGAFLALSRFLPRPRGWREVELEVRKGQLAIRGTGWLGRRQLRAREVIALSTASGQEGRVALALSLSSAGLGRTTRPLLIEVSETEQADIVCDALGVGRRGLGQLEWPTAPRSNDRAERLAVAGLLLSSIALPLIRLGSRSEEALVLTGMTLFASLVLFLATALQSKAPPPALRLKPESLDLSQTGCGWAEVPYDCIERVERTDEGIALTLSPPHSKILIPVAPGPFAARQAGEDEMAHVIAQIQDASLRARGFGRAERPLGDGVDELRRGGESVRAWLERLDGYAVSLGKGSAYRHELVSSHDLWQALEDPDADAELRVAAARVLVRVAPEEARLRVATVAETVHDEDMRRGLVMAAEDEESLDEMASHLEHSSLWVRRA
jgi:hypothetical protein